ncbi:MAG: FAD-dependent oxidoreductase [Planctomycetota bacterium]
MSTPPASTNPNGPSRPSRTNHPTSAQHQAQHCGQHRTGGTILVVGAGPTGLGAGYRLRELGYADYSIVEASDSVGGLARSLTDEAGFTWDIGGHVLFSHYDTYDRIFDELVGDDYTLNNRESWVRLADAWVPYPFQNNLRYLPEPIADECLRGLIEAQSTGEPPSTAPHFGAFIDRVFGAGIADRFMNPYNFKVWAYEPGKLNTAWIGERVAVIDWKRALTNVVTGRDDFGWGPNNRFKYPLGGTGDFYRRFEPLLADHLRLGTRLVSIDTDAKRATFEDRAGQRTTESYESLISTIPVDRLVTEIIDAAPEGVREAAGRLLHSGGYMVGIGIERPCPSTRSWMYFPEGDCPFYRVTYLSNYSPRMTPDPDRFYSLLCETSFSPDKPEDESTIIERTIAGLESTGLLEPGERDDIVSTWLHKVEYSYPTPSVERDEILSVVIPWLESVGIYSRGRFGLWKYEVSNTDHSVMQGVEAVDRLVLGAEERTTGLVYRVTDDGRRAADHERPGTAGSGEKRLKPQPSAGPRPVADTGDAPEASLSEEELGVTDRR